MITGLIWWIIVGLIAGWLAGKIVKRAGYGVFVDTILGMVGAVVGGLILRTLGFYTSGGLVPSILVATLGAVILVWLAHKLK
ncbi:MAG TPA: GlsB/YeaQ/YmgE family stress response membrane protein [Candidatus Angelobacter sp.]|jgi:uncharacterized membrane protein YeaQ/YmgE (transglycosylase-associated protein family)